MRALDSRRPRPPSISSSLLPRGFVSLLLVLLALDAARARGLPRELPRDEEDAPPSTEKLSEIAGLIEPQGEEVSATDELTLDVRTRSVDDPVIKPSDDPVIQPSDDSKSEETRKRKDVVDGNDLGTADGETDEKEGTQAEGIEEDGSVVKKRRRNDVVSSGKSGLEEAQEGEKIEEDTGEAKNEGIRRFDVRVDADDRVSLGEKDVDVGDRRYRVTKDEETEVPDARVSGTIEGTDDSDDRDENVSSEVGNVGEETAEDASTIRGYRYLGKNRGKSRYKSSTVYLNAEEKKIPVGEQESIVDGQIKKLISIRDDALGQKSVENLDEAKVLISKEGIESDEEIAVEDDGLNERTSEKKNSLGSERKEEPDTNGGRLKRLRNQALVLQEQIRNRTFLQYLKEQAIEVLPDVPKFTETQLLNVLRKIPPSKNLEPPSEYFSSNVTDPALSEDQLQIIKCAESLVAPKQRQPFVTNMMECIRGLSVLNCMRIFVWPIVVENLPESINQNLANLPIEVNLFDLFQGVRAKSARAHDLREIELLAPETVVFGILREALTSRRVDESSPTFVDPRNETLKKLLTEGQVEILRMAERLLPEAARREFSDRMFSCVRRFEYYSCVKYFAWPMVRNYYPSLPAFPEYQAWYPTVAFFPEYPILPFPGFSEDTGELPEVVEADATRTKKPKPEAAIAEMFRNTFKDQSAPSYVTLIPVDQLTAIHPTEQLLPPSYAEFAKPASNCITQYNRVICFKNTWPPVRQSLPSLSDITGIFSDIQYPALSDLLDYFPSFISFPDISTFWPGTSTTTPAPSTTTVSARFGGQTGTSLNELEVKLLNILLKIAGPQETIPSQPPSDSSSTDESAMYTPKQRQKDILRLAHNLVPPSERFDLVATSVVCYHYTSDFANCTKHYVWPVVQRYHPDLPEFPKFENENVQAAQNELPSNLGEKARERLVSDGLEDQSPKITSRTPLQSEESPSKGPQSVPVITVTGTRFVPIFTEHPESVIFNILRSVQLASPSANEGDKGSLVDTQGFTDLLNPQQESIVKVTQTLLPQSARPDFVSKMVDCVRGANFLTCSRDILWPALIEYFPRMPSFPNFGILPISASGTVSSTSPQNLTEHSSSSDAPPLAETNVKTGQHGDATVTITDTRFFPILNELPETVILNILRAVELSTPTLPRAAAPVRAQNFPNLSEQQVNIVQAAENLLPFSVRPVFIERMLACVRNNNFLRCTRDVAWPAVTEYFPRLPNFPDFGGVQNTPRAKLQVFLDDPSLGTIKQEVQPLENLNEDNPSKLAEEKLEEVLTTTLQEASKPRLEESYLNADDPVVKSRLNERQINIVRLIESGLPELDRPGFVSEILECAKDESFLSCTEKIGWSSLKQSLPSLPPFPSLDGLFGQLPTLPQFPDLGKPPSIPGIGSFPFQDIPGIPQLPSGFPQFPGGFPQLPSGFPQIPSGFPQFPSGIPQIPGFPQFGGNVRTRSAQGQTPPHRPAIVNFNEEMKRLSESTAPSPLVDFRGEVPEYAGQPAGIFVDIASEKVKLSEDASNGQLAKGAETKAPESLEKGKTRKRRNVVDLFASYRDLEDETADTSLEGVPNITESELLRLLISLTKNKKSVELKTGEPKRYFVDTLNSTVRDSLTADQYEILKMVEDLTYQSTNRGFVQQVIQCIRGLSFIKCMGIFVWPIITNNLPSLIGLPSLPTIPTFGLLGRSTETEVQDFFGMNTVEFEKELLLRKESMEKFLLSCYKKLLEEKFQTNVGFLRINGYGNGELGISIAGYREGRGTKIKDNKNLPSILTIISDIMEEVLDQRPDNEKVKKDKDKKERSLDDPAESDIQFLKDTEEYADVKRSVNDDQLIKMFLDKIKTNGSDVGEGEVKQYVNLEQAYNAFEGLFGTRLGGKLTSKLDAMNGRHDSIRDANSDDPVKEVHIVPLELQRRNSDQPKVLPLKNQMTYVLEKESSREQEDRRRQKRAKNFAAFSLDEFSNEYPPEVRAEILESEIEENEIEKSRWKDARKEFVVNLPSLEEDIVPRKMTSSMMEFGKGFKTKVMQLMPGVGLVLSFLVQMALAHARAAASMAGMISNMALGSAMFTMIRQALFGPSTEPKIKYVYDNDKMGPGISWPHEYGSHPYYRS